MHYLGRQIAAGKSGIKCEARMDEFLFPLGSGPLSMVSLRTLQNFKQILKKCFVKVVKIFLVERPVNTSLS